MKKIILLSLLLCLSLASFAQTTESNCGNGIDDDNDGRIDCFDGDCANDAACEDAYTGHDKDCQLPQPPGSLFEMELKEKSDDRVTTTHGRFVVGDMDGDGIPEVVTAHASDDKVYILDGRTLEIKFEGDTEYAPDRYDITIGNVNGDNCAEIFLSETYQPPKPPNADDWWDPWPPKEFYVSSYDCQGNHLWSTRVHERAFTMGLADFDHDGKTEIYFRNQILDASSGMSLVAGSGNWQAIDGGPVAVDILAAHPGLELVLGGEIYSVTLPTTRNPGDVNTGTLTVRKKFNDLPGLVNVKYYPKAIDLGGDKFVNSQTSIADFDQDGHLDVLMTGASKNSTGSAATVFYWNVEKETYRTYQPKQSNGNGWAYGCGRLNLADIDGDGKMNVAFVSGNRLFVLDENLNVLKLPGNVDWIKTISEVSSGYTSTTVFDFNNDNASEIVYRDEDYLYIFNGKTGAQSPAIACKSLTSNDYPIVVDVDADGSTEICVVCQDGSGSNDGVIRSYKSALEPWVSARKVWNQHAYFNVNVNDDLTIPRYQQDHSVIFSTSICPAPKPGDPPIHNRALNSFLNQSAILDSKGCKTYATADIAFEPDPQLMNIIPPTCPDQDFKVSFTLKNIGDLTLDGVLPISFYNGDPRVAGAEKLSTINVNLNDVAIGDTVRVLNRTITGTGGMFTLFAVLNDDGSTLPLDFDDAAPFAECNYLNNIVSAEVDPAPFALTVNTTPHVQCGTDPSPANGTAEIFKLEGTDEVTVGYTFYWFNGATVGDTTAAVAEGASRSDLLNGTYSVVAYHNAFRCGSAPAVVNVGLDTRDISASITIDHDFTNCNNPDGQLTAIPDGGLPTTNFTYEWFEGTQVSTSDVLSVTNVLTGARGLTYSVLITEIGSGCETIESETVPDQTDQFHVAATSTPAKCTPSNSGSATANVDGGTAGYEFLWYDGSTEQPSADFTGVTYNNLLAGDYTVVARRIATGCKSAPFLVKVQPAPGITVTAEIDAQQTSCATPNGAASASVDIGAATYKWFSGSTTNPASEIGTGAIIPGLAAGTYTVEATSTTTGCTSTDEITIVDNIVNPTVDASAVAQTSCLPANGSVSATVSVTTDAHTFYWFNGNVGTPDTTLAVFKGATYPARTAGFYTVVAVNNATRCASIKDVVEVLDNTVDPIVGTTVTHQTSCVPASPNGGASANVGGGTAGFKFRWFNGNDTTTFITQAPSISNRAAGTYTVKAVNLTTGCFGTAIVTINQLAAKPVLSVSKIDNTICSSAIGFNGSVTSAITTNPNVQAGHTLVYSWTRNGVGMAGETGASVTGVDNATYAVTLTNQTLGCTSDPASATVVNNFDLPDLASTFDGSTNCDPSIPNGKARLTSVEGAAPTNVGFTYQWHTGTDTSTPITVASNATADDFELAQIQGGAGMNYTVLVTTLATGCQNTATVLVPDNSVLPQLSLTPTPNSICDASLATNPYNGSVAATITNQGVFALSDYQFSWTDEETGLVVFSALGGATAGQNLLNRDSSYYSLVVTQISTGCVSSPATAQVTSTASLPDITALPSASTNCDPDLADGGVAVTDVDGVGTPANYIFEWHRGNTLAGTLIANGAVSPDTLQGGVGRFFTVLVTNQDDGCQNTETVEVPDDSALPLFMLTPSPNGICDETLATAAYNGSVVANITNQGTFPLNDYKFDWTDEETGANVFSALGGAAGGQALLNRDSSVYSLVITQVSTGCISSPASAQVTTNAVLPDVATQVDASTNCDPALADGSVEVTDVDGLGTPANFVFEWHRGSTITGTLVANAAVSPDTLQGGTNRFFTVLVTNTDDGCQRTETVLLPQNITTPDFSLLPTPNTVCDDAFAPYDGSIAVTITNQAAFPIEDYQFEWTDEESGAVVLDALGGAGGGQTLQGRDSSIYSLVITQVSTGCPSGRKTAEILPDFFIPVIDVAMTPQTACVGTNGILAASVDETTNGGGVGEIANYVFEWFEGNVAPGTVLVATTTGTNGEVNQLAGNLFYTVRVTSNATGCQNTETAYVDEDIVLPVPSIAATDQTACAPANGELVATVVPAPSQTYSFFWLKEQPLTTTTDPAAVITAVTTSSAMPNRMFTGANGVDTDTHENITYGNYTLVVRDDYTQCVSLTGTETVGDETASDITFNIGNRPSACADTDGVLEFQAARVDGAPSSFIFEIYLGGPTNAVTPIDYNSTPPNPPVFDLALNNGTPMPVVAFPQTHPAVGTGVNASQGNLRSDLYTVIAEDDYGCKNVATFFLPFFNAHEIDVTSTDSEICPYTIGDGSLSIAVVPPPSDPGLNQTRFTFKIYDGANPNTASALVLGPDPAPSIIGDEICGDGLDNDGDGIADEGCPYTNPYTLPFSGEDCDDGVDNDGDGLIDGADPDCSGRLTANNLAPGFYAIEIQENVTAANCKVYEVIEIKATALAPVITLSEMTPNTACDLAGADGAIEINIDQNPADPTTPTYDLAMNPDPHGVFPMLGIGTGDYDATQLVPNTYTFTVTGSNGCIASTAIEVENRPANAEILSQNVSVVDAEFCDATLETSARAEVLRISIANRAEICGNGVDDDGDGLTDNADPDCSDNLDDYEFEWYTNAALSQIILASTPGDNTVANGGEVLSNVGSPAPAADVTTGTYYVVATKTNAGATGGFGCESAPIRIDIGDRTVDPVVAANAIGDTSCDEINFEGRIEITASTPNLGLGAPYSNPGATGVYTYEWAGTNPTPITDSNGNDGDATDADGDEDIARILEVGTYTFKVINENTGCETNVSTIVEKESPPAYTINATAFAQTLCDPSGSIQITDVLLGGISDGTANFEYTWYRNDPTTAPLEDGASTPIAATLLNNVNYTTIGAGSYYIVAKRLPGIGSNNGSGCESAPHRIDIIDESINPTVVLTPSANTACDANFEGSILVQVTNPGSLATPTYLYDWDDTNPVDIDGGTPIVSNNDGIGADDNPQNLEDGIYRLIVENTATGCKTLAQTNILSSETPIVVAQATPQPQVICDPDGSITVNAITVDGANEPDHSLFDFTWYRNNTSSAPIVPVVAGEDVLDVNNFATIGAGTYFVKVKRVSGGPGSGCESAPLRVDIQDQSVDPTVVLTPFANTACDGNFEGSILVDVTNPGSGATATYTYNWDEVANPFDIEGIAAHAGIVANDDGAGSDDNPTNLPNGVYKLQVENNATGCRTQVQTSILRSETPIVVAMATPQPQLICAADGSITVNDVVVGGVVEPDHSLFHFTWYRNTNSSVIIPATAGEDVLDVSNFASIGAGTYFVKAQRTTGGPGSGCESAPLRVDVADQRQFPVVNFATTVNTSCTDANADAAITVMASTTGVGAGSNYDFAWTSNPASPAAVADALNVASPYTTLATDNILHGSYAIRVTNRTTQCFTDASVTIEQNTPTIEILSVSKLDQFDCAPFDGQITVDGSNGAHVSLPGTYTFTWAKGATALPVPTPDNVLSGLDAGTYFVTATKTNDIGFGCVSAPFAVDILPMMQNPAIDLTSIANFACIAPFNGQISASVTEGVTSGVTAGYEYEWFTGLNNTNAANSLGARSAGFTSLVAREQGDYTVEVTDMNSPNRGCVNTATMPIAFASTDISSDISAIMQTLCAPAQNGALEVQIVREMINGVTTSYDMSNPAHLARFNFQWFNETMAPVAGVNNTLPGQEAGEYHLRITNDLGCQSSFTSRVIEDQNSYPLITLEDFVNPTLCRMPEIEGQLQVSADNSLNFGNYTFTWFEGPDVTGTQVLANNPSLEDVAFSDPLKYTVRVTNNATNCFSIKSYTLAVDTLSIKVIASAVPLSSCLANNGTLFASSVDGVSNLYNYEWYAGSTVTGTPVFTTKEVTTAPLGTFTVIAVNPNHAFCESIPATTEVTDGRIYPPVEIEQKNPLTYCDPANPNGVAKATVGGSIIGYSFDWFVGNDASGASFYSGSEVDGLRAIAYTAQATDNVTGCAGVETIVIENEPVQVPSPLVTILSHRTNCLVLDGALRAVADGPSINSTLQWYNGGSVSAVPDQTGEFYRDLDAGLYTTTATDLISGCVSPPVVTEILPLMEIPEFDIETVPTNCEANVGQATFIPTSEYPIKSMEWNIDGTTYTDVIVSNLPKGKFSITVVTTKDCPNTKEFEILPEILVFNGVSRNGDGNNDFFEISCIQDFENNTVKIFNRAGTLVYQARGYNNSDVYFDGTSNEGLSLMGRELPDGTYFYIIDKGDGSKPKSGYLELLRQ